MTLGKYYRNCRHCNAYVYLNRKGYWVSVEGTYYCDDGLQKHDVECQK